MLNEIDTGCSDESFEMMNVEFNEDNTGIEVFNMLLSLITIKLIIDFQRELAGLEEDDNEVMNDKICE